MTAGFNADVYEGKRKEESYNDKWYAIHKINHVFIGKVVKVKEGKIIFNPYRGTEYDEKGEERITLIKKSLEVPILDGVGLEELSEEGVLNRITCDNLNLEKQKIEKNHIKK